MGELAVRSSSHGSWTSIMKTEGQGRRSWLWTDIDAVITEYSLGKWSPVGRVKLFVIAAQYQTFRPNKTTELLV